MLFSCTFSFQKSYKVTKKLVLKFNHYIEFEMTVVIGFIIDTNPLLIGDILISSEEIVGKSIDLPLIGDVRNVFPEGSGYVPTSLRQKLAIISDDLAIGWSGTKIAAKTIINEMIELNKRTPFTKETFEEFINNIDPIIVKQGFSFVGFLNNRETSEILRFRISNDKNFKEFRDDNGCVVLIGSGTDELLNFIEPTGIKPHPPEEDKIQATINTGLEYAGSLLSFELATWQSLFSYFGAGYELPTFINNKFIKVGDITYLFWFGNVSNDNVSLSLQYFSKYSYIDDILLIRSARVQFIEIENIKIVDDQIFIVDPVYRESTDEEKEKFVKPSYNSNFICNYFLFRKEGSEFLFIFTSIENVNNGKPSIKFIQVDEQLNIRIEKEWFENFRTHIYNQTKL